MGHQQAAALERPTPSFSPEISGQRYSDKWKENKKFAVQALRKSGFGAPSSEQKVQAQVSNHHFTMPLISLKFKPLHAMFATLLKSARLSLVRGRLTCRHLRVQIDELLLYVRELGGEAVDLLEPLRFTTANVIASVLVSASYPWGHPDQIQVSASRMAPLTRSALWKHNQI